MSGDFVSYDTNEQNPAPPPGGVSPQLSFQDLWALVDSERGRCVMARDYCTDKLAIETMASGRNLYTRAIAEHTRRMIGFEKIMRLLDIIGTDRTIKQRLWEIAEAEAAEGDR
jgi:hypothetical protein